MIWKALTVFLMSTVKFAFAFPVAYGADLPFWWMFLSTTLGGITGVLIFGVLSDRITAWWVNRRISRNNGKPHKIFTRSNRRLVRIKTKYGLPGIAFLTPALLSIPVGTFLAIRYYRHEEKKAFLYLAISVIAWSLLFCSFGSAVDVLVP
ncbi:MAG: hypothetical protein KDD36_10465 [Flavobacteriales bacterium]|nr:hypothetical protein [Flavobacteriales bacterium]